MKKLFLIVSMLPVCMHAMEHSAKFPKDIYEAIKKKDLYAIEYYARAGQVNEQDRDVDAEVDRIGRVPGDLMRPLCRLTLFCGCIPLCSGVGISTRTPLHYALAKKNIAAARTLINSGARLNTGQWKTVQLFQCFFCDPIYVSSPEPPGCTGSSPVRATLAFEPASVLLAKLARTRVDAKGLLREVVDRGLPLMSRKAKIDDELLRRLLALNDVPLLQQIVQNGLISSAYLACAVAENGGHLDDVSFIFEQPASDVASVSERFLSAITRTGDRRLVDMALRENPGFLSDVCRAAVISKYPELVDHVLSKNPQRADITRLMPLVRLRAIAERLDRYNPLAAPITRLMPLVRLRAIAERLDRYNPLAAPAQAAPPPSIAQVQHSACAAGFEFAPEGCAHPDYAQPTPPAPDCLSLSSAAQEAGEESLAADNCPVCLTPLASRAYVRRLPCGHNVHGECLSVWLREHHTCPVCRQPVG